MIDPPVILSLFLKLFGERMADFGVYWFFWDIYLAWGIYYFAWLYVVFQLYGYRIRIIARCL